METQHLLSFLMWNGRQRGGVVKGVNKDRMSVNRVRKLRKEKKAKSKRGRRRRNRRGH